jgi:hypothetical protein
MIWKKKDARCFVFHRFNQLYCFYIDVALEAAEKRELELRITIYKREIT